MVSFVNIAVLVLLQLAASVAAAEGTGTKFAHFTAYNDTMTCSGDEHSTKFNEAVRGVNLGSYMVLEPWITPSLFYQFLGKKEGEVGMDSYSFCEVLGGEEANRQLKNHWETWVTEELITKLKDSGAVNSLRLPIGDFQFIPYGPYLNGCWDGGLEYVDKVLDWAYSNGLSVLLDVHAMKDSQNGFDNSGQTLGFQWTTQIGFEYAPSTTFEHWPMRTANWMGEFDYKTNSYPTINRANVEHSLNVLQLIIDRYKNHPAVMGLEPVNEPWEHTPIEELKRYYWEGYLKVKKEAPYWRYVMHDSFRPTPDVWGGFMDGCPDRAIDMHIYQAWRDPDSRLGFYRDACNQKRVIADMEREFGPIIVGEWSLATDNCVMWLNGFNDNLPGFPRLPCKYVKCADPYMGMDVQPNAPVDPTKPMQGPYGTGQSGPSFGFCPVDRDWSKETSGDPQTGRDWVRAPPNIPSFLDDTDNVMTHLAAKKISAFSGIGHGFYFWNFRTELDSPQWDYMRALERGWIPRGNLGEERIEDACRAEDSGVFRCTLKRNIPDKPIRDAIHYINDVTNATEDARSVEGLSGKELRTSAEPLIEAFFEEGRKRGVTCDFGGIGVLVEENVTIDDDSVVIWNDDEYYTTVIINEGLSWVWITIYVVVGTIAGSIVGFVTAMRMSKKFNKAVRQSAFFQNTIGQNPAIRKSLAVPALRESLEELEYLFEKDENDAVDGNKSTKQQYT